MTYVGCHTNRLWLRAVFASVVIRAEKRKPEGYIESPQTVGEHIRKVRLDRGLFQKEVAQILNVNTTSIENWESGRRTPKTKQLTAIIDFLGFIPQCLV